MRDLLLPHQRRALTSRHGVSPQTLPTIGVSDDSDADSSVDIIFSSHGAPGDDGGADGRPPPSPGAAAAALQELFPAGQPRAASPPQLPAEEGVKRLLAAPGGGRSAAVPGAAQGQPQQSAADLDDIILHLKEEHEKGEAYDDEQQRVHATAPRADWEEPSFADLLSMEGWLSGAAGRLARQSWERTASGQDAQAGSADQVEGEGLPSQADIARDEAAAAEAEANFRALLCRPEADVVAEELRSSGFAGAHAPSPRPSCWDPLL